MIAPQSSSRPRRGDSGFSLVELIIAIAISVMVVAVVGGLLINSARTQNAVRTSAAATNLGQLIARTIEAGVRNASAATVVTDAVAGTQLLLVRSVSGSANPQWSCRAWYFTPAGGGAMYMTSTTPAAAITVPSGGPDGSWTLIGDGLTTVDAAAATNVFSAPSGRVDLKFEVTSGSQLPVLVQTTTYLRKAATESAPCF